MEDCIHLLRKINTGRLLILHKWGATFGVTEDQQFGRAQFHADFPGVLRMIDSSEDKQTCPKKLHTQNSEISSTNLRFTPESGEEVRQCGELVRQHLVFGLKVEYALSSEVFTRFLGRF